MWATYKGVQIITFILAWSVRYNHFNKQNIVSYHLNKAEYTYSFRDNHFSVIVFFTLFLYICYVRKDIYTFVESVALFS